MRNLIGNMAVLSVVLAVLFVPSTADAVPPDGVFLPLTDGTTLHVNRDPFRVAIVGVDGDEDVATVAGAEGPPVRLPGLDGPQPFEPLGPAGAFPAVGFVVGAGTQVTWPFPLYTGNRIFGTESGAVVSRVGVTATSIDGGVLSAAVRTDAPTLGDATLTATALPGGGVRLEVAPPDGIEPISSLFTLRSPPGEGLYGLGARKDRFDQRGLLRNVWTEQQNASDERVEPATCATFGCDYTFPNGAQAAYFVQPSLHGSTGWSAWVRNTALSRVDLAASRDDAVRWGVAAARLDLALAGGGLERSAIAHTADVGRAPAPPSWVYEPWVDVINEGEGEAAPNGGGFTGGQRVRDELVAIVAGHDELGIPLGVLGVEGCQAVPNGPALFSRLRAAGYRLSAYWNPFHSPGNAGYDEAAARELFIEDPAGQPYPFINNRGSLTYAIDWTKPGASEFWDEQLARSMELGFEGWMHDFGEFVTEGMRFHDGTPPEAMHNGYPVLLHAASQRAAETFAAGTPGFEPFFYVRAGFDGVQPATGSVFPGDETTDWSQGSGLPSIVPTMLNLALGGLPTFTTDVGGYFDFVAPRTTPELLVRWGQAAALTPVMRVHNSTQNTSLYPHELEGQQLDAYRRYARLKVRLAPQVDRLTRAAARGEGIGPVRPLVLADDSDAARSIDDQWLLGEDLLVAPVLEPGATSRSVYLPAGDDWQRVVVADDGSLRATGEPAPGGRRIDVPVTIADIPLFTRAAPVGTGRTPDAALEPTDPSPTGQRALAATGGGAATAASLLLVGAAALSRRRR